MLAAILFTNNSPRNQKTPCSLEEKLSGHLLCFQKNTEFVTTLPNMLYVDYTQDCIVKGTTMDSKMRIEEINLLYYFVPFSSKLFIHLLTVTEIPLRIKVTTSTVEDILLTIIMFAQG